MRCTKCNKKFEIDDYIDDLRKQKDISFDGEIKSDETSLLQ